MMSSPFCMHTHTHTHTHTHKHVHAHINKKIHASYTKTEFKQISIPNNNIIQIEMPSCTKWSFKPL
jgi:hypothetical protein